MERWYYNCGLDIFNKDDNHTHVIFNKKVSYFKLRDIIQTYNYTEQQYENLTIIDFIKQEGRKQFPCPSYWKDQVHNRIPRGAIKSLVGNLNSAFSNKKNGNIKNFRLSYKTKKNKQYTALFEDGSYPAWINNIKGWYRFGRNRISFKDIVKSVTLKNLIVSLDREIGRYYVYLPVEAGWSPERVENQDNLKPNRPYEYISLDTGIRTFQTGYSEDHIVEIGKESHRLSSLLLKIDKLNELISGINQAYKKKRLKRRKVRLEYKIKCLVDDIHWKTIHFLTSRYNTIIIPDFRITGMVNKKIPKIVKRLLYGYSFFKFKERLTYKCSVRGNTLHIVDESYTSKTCGRCGSLNNKLKSQKEFVCPSCGLKIDRDINGARNILIRNWPALQGH